MKLRVKGDEKTESKKEGLKDRLRKILAFGFIAFIIFLIVVGMLLLIFEPKTSRPTRVSFHDASTEVSLWDVLYYPNDTVELRVEAEAWLRVAIASIELNSSIKGLENVTLYSGGRSDWGDTIWYVPPGHNRTDAEYCDFVLPLDLPIIENTTSKLYLTIKIKYVHPCPSEVLEDKFYNAYETEFITINLDATSSMEPHPPPPHRLK